MAGWIIKRALFWKSLGQGVSYSGSLKVGIYYTYRGMKFSTQTGLNVIRQLKQNNMNSSETKLLRFKL